jgi:hypothetical protein
LKGCSSERWNRWFIAALMDFLAAEPGPEGPRPEANNRAIPRNEVPAGHRLQLFDRVIRLMDDQWYGPGGRAATFLSHSRAIFQGFEWDKVDSRLLLHDVAFPVTLHLAMELGLPALVLCMSLWDLPIYAASRRRLVTRSCLFLYSAFLSQSQKVWRARFRRWFQAAHRLARDDRYLIGEVLLNYNEQ